MDYFLEKIHSHPEGQQCPNKLKWLQILLYDSKSLGNYVMVYKMTKNPKILKRIFLVTALEN